MDPLTINVAPAVTAMLVQVNEFQKWVESRAHFEHNLNEFARTLNEREAKIAQRSTDLDAIHQQLKAANGALDTREIKVKNREDGAANISKELSLERAKTKGLRDREVKLEGKIEELEKEVAGLNAHIQKHSAESTEVNAEQLANAAAFRQILSTEVVPAPV